MSYTSYTPDYTPDYTKAVRVAMEVLEDYEISQAPIDLFKITDDLSNELRLVPYSAFMKWYGLDLGETKNLLQSDLGTTLISPPKNRRIILYNDTCPRETCRFTVAHELGHLFLEHPSFLTITKDGVEEADISKSDYDNYEKESNAFARNLLSPAPLAMAVMEKAPSGRQNSYVESAFLISHSAANVRINFVRRDLREYSKHMQLYAQSIDLLFHRYCMHCGTKVPDGNSYCEICGGSDFAVGTHYKKTPHSILRRKKNGQFKYCPVCHNEEISTGSHYCRICGTPIQNFCTGNPRHHNRVYARYCSECGAPTTYGALSIFKSFNWGAGINEDANGNRNNEGDDTMRYTDGVAYDKDTMRVKICPVCHNEEFGKGAIYCRICGTPLYNTCENGITEDINGEPIVLSMHMNPPNARFCECCGKPTVYYTRHILRDYKTYIETEAKDLVAIGLCDNEDEARGLVTAPMESDNSTASSPSHASALTPDPASAPAPVSTPAPMPSPTPQDDPDITFPAPLDSISNIGNIDMPIDIDEELPFN